MISNYSRPQTEIFQVLENTANPLLDRIHAVVVGPAFIHADADADNLNFQTYEQDSEVGYSLVRDGAVVIKGAEVVDQPAVSLSAKNLRIELFNSTNFIPSSTDPSGNVVVYDDVSGFYDAANPDVAELFDHGRIPTPGDVYKLTDGVTTIERKVVGILGKDLDSAVNFSSYQGALEYPFSTLPATLATLVSANFSNGGVDEDASMSAAAKRYVRRYGKAGLGDQGGLRLSIVVTCTSGDGTNAGSTFSATINGVTTSATAANSSSADSLFTLAGTSAIKFKVLGYRAWQTNDRISLTIDYSDEVIAPDSTLFDGSLDSSAYTFAASSKRVASSITVEVLSISDSDVYTLRVSDSSGLMTPVVITSNGSAPVTTELSYDGSTVSFTSPTFTADQLHVGQKFVFLVTPPSRSTTIFDKVLFNLPIGNLNFTSLIAYTSYSGEVAATEPVLSNVNYTVGADGLTLGTIQVSVPGYTNVNDSVHSAVDGIGQIAPIWRAAISAGVNEGLVAIDSYQDILDNFYSVGIGSELGYGVLKAFNGSQGKRVYALNTGGSTLEDFTAAFNKLESANNVYTIAVLTEDEDVMKLAALHVQTMSAPTVKKFRRAYVGTDSPGEYPIIDLKSDETAYTADIQMGGSGSYNLVIFNDELDLSLYTITAGDFLQITGTGAKYAIEEVQDATLPGGVQTLALILKDDIGFPLTGAAVKVIAADTPENTARYVWERSARLGSNTEQDRRIANIWQDSGTLSGTTIPNRFGACEIAGIRTALQPQQGLTRTEVSFIESCPAMYTKFRPSLLDEMASRGVWIITQNSAEGVVYIRHQLTTAVSNGSLYYEDNAGVNVDSICFGLDDLNDPLIGKRNATPNTVIEIKHKDIAFLSGLTKESLVNPDLGPQVVNFYNAAGEAGTLDVAIDPNFKDRINEFVIVEIPLPLNNIRIVVQGRTIKNDGVFVNAITTSVATA